MMSARFKPYPPSPTDSISANTGPLQVTHLIRRRHVAEHDEPQMTHEPAPTKQVRVDLGERRGEGSATSARPMMPSRACGNQPDWSHTSTSVWTRPGAGWLLGAASELNTIVRMRSQTVAPPCLKRTTLSFLQGMMHGGPMSEEGTGQKEETRHGNQHSPSVP